MSAHGRPPAPLELGMLGEKSLFSKQNALRRLRILAPVGRPARVRRPGGSPRPPAHVLALAARERYARCVRCLIWVGRQGRPPCVADVELFLECP